MLSSNTFFVLWILVIHRTWQSLWKENLVYAIHLCWNLHSLLSFEEGQHMIFLVWKKSWVQGILDRIPTNADMVFDDWIYYYYYFLVFFFHLPINSCHVLCIKFFCTFSVIVLVFAFQANYLSKRIDWSKCMHIIILFPTNNSPLAYQIFIFSINLI